MDGMSTSNHGLPTKGRNLNVCVGGFDDHTCVWDVQVSARGTC